jgi:hypothetical protein
MMTTDKQTPTWRQQFTDEYCNAFLKKVIARDAAYLALYTFAGEIIPVPDSGLTIGRDADADVRTDDDYISNRHARLYRDGQQLMIEDLGSTNGTWLNENRVWDKAPLSLDDVIRVGRTRFAVTWVTSEEQG